MNRLKLSRGKELLVGVCILLRMNPETLFGSGTGNLSENLNN